MPLKNLTASAGFEPANLGTKGQHATSRPPKPHDCFGITEHERKEKCDSQKVTECHTRVEVLDHPEGVGLIHHNKACEDVCGQAGSKENSPGRGEALRRPARNVDQQPYMHDVRRLDTGAELFYITTPNNVCCISVISLIITLFNKFWMIEYYG